jgi:hypothetical protein
MVLDGARWSMVVVNIFGWVQVQKTVKIGDKDVRA